MTSLLDVEYRQVLLDLIQTSAEKAPRGREPLDLMALELCAHGGSSATSVLLRLLDMHASTREAVDSQGNTLLHYASQSGRCELVTRLLSRSPALCTVRNSAGASAFDVAATDAVKALIRMASPDCAMEEETVDFEMDNQTPCLLNLPEEMLVHVCCQLVEPSHLLRMRQCCRKLRVLADSDIIWERLCWTTYRRAARTSCLAGTWREIYIEHTLLQGDSKARRLSWERAREERYLDRRSLAGLERLCQRSVERQLT